MSKVTGTALLGWSCDIDGERSVKRGAKITLPVERAKMHEKAGRFKPDADAVVDQKKSGS